MGIEYREVLRATNEGAFAPGDDPNNWQYNYAFNQTPASNGFSVAQEPGAVVTYRRNGPASGRYINVAPAGLVSFNQIFNLVSSPQLNPAVGVSGEFACAVAPETGFRYVAAGIEFTYVDGAGSLTVTPDGVYLSVSGWPEYAVESLDNTALTTWRLTIDDGRVCRVYRDGVLIITTNPIDESGTAGLRFIFWGEGGAV